MDSIAPTFVRFLADEEGVTAIEYGLIAALVSIAIIAGVKFIGTSINELFLYWANAVVTGTS